MYLPTANYCLCALSRKRDAKAKNEAILQGGRLGGKRGVKAVQVEVFFAGDRRSALVGSLPCPVLRDPGLFVFWFCWSGDPHHRIHPHVSDVLWKGDFEVANR